MCVYQKKRKHKPVSISFSGLQRAGQAVPLLITLQCICSLEISRMHCKKAHNIKIFTLIFTCNTYISAFFSNIQNNLTKDTHKNGGLISL